VIAIVHFLQCLYPLIRSVNNFHVHCANLAPPSWRCHPGVLAGHSAHLTDRPYSPAQRSHPLIRSTAAFHIP
jgi:hypothetical protein